MKKFFKFTLSLITLGFTVILVGFLFVINLNPNEHKDWIAGKFEEQTGLPLSLNGNITLTFYPWLGVTLDDVVIGNTPGFGETPILQAEHAEFRARFLPLLNREYEIDTIHLMGATIYLETNTAGEGNWQAAVPANETENPADSTGPAFNNLVLGGVDIRNSSLTFNDRFNDVIYQVNNISISTDELVFGEPVDLYLGFDASATRPALSGQVNLTGTVIYDLDNERYDLNPFTLTGTLSGQNVPGGTADITLTTAVSFDYAQDVLTLRDLSLNALDAQINANVNASGVLSESSQYQVNVAAAGNDLAVLFSILENDALVNQISSLGNKTFSFSGLIESSPGAGKLTITGLDASLLNADITGEINAVNLQSGNPVVNGFINAQGPDLPTLLEVAGQMQGGRDSPLAVYGRELRQSPDRSFLLNSRFDANLETGNIDVPELEARILGATVRGNVNAINIRSDTPVIRGRLDASGPDLPLMMQIAGQLSSGRDSPLNQYGRQLRTVSNKSFRIVAPFDVNLTSGNMDISNLEASFLTLRVNGDLKASNFQDRSGTINGKLTLSGSNLQEVLTAIDQPELAEVVQSIDLEVSVNGSRDNLYLSPLHLDAALARSGNPNSPVTLAMNADTVLNLEAETMNTRSFTLAGLGLNLQGSVEATNIMDAFNYQGRVSVPQFNLRSFLGQLNQPLPPTRDNTVFRALALQTDFAGSTNDLRLNNLDLVLDNSQITGDFTLAGFDNPAMNFNLAVDTINLDRYQAPELENAPSYNENTELPVDTLRSLDLKGKLNAGQLTYANLKLQNISLDINASDGQLALSPISANLYQGTYKGDIRLDVNGDTPVASVDTNFNGIRLAPLLQDFMDATYVSGTGNIKLALTGSGADTNTIKRNLNGTGSLDLQDGVLEGVDVAGVLNQLEIMIREQRPASLVRGERTPFESFTATINVDNGIVSTNDLLIESSSFNVTGRGTLANLTNDTINFSLVANVDESPATNERAYDIGGYPLPIACTGSLAGPTCLPDIQAIIAGAIQSAIQRGLTSLLERAVGNETTDQTQDSANTQNNTDTQDQQQEEETDPREELLNRALDSIFRR